MHSNVDKLLSLLMKVFGKVYWMIVERYPKPNGVLANSFPAMKSSLYSMEKLARWPRASCVPKRKEKREIYVIILREKISSFGSHNFCI